jgi:hypothetical protein
MEVSDVHPESQFSDPERRLQPTEDAPNDGPHMRNKAAETALSFDMEETADIVLPIDHPIFGRRHGSR